MALTEYEKKILEQMEASLREEDPALASQMSSPTLDEDDNESARGPRTPRRIALGFAGAVLGMVVPCPQAEEEQRERWLGFVHPGSGASLGRP